MRYARKQSPRGKFMRSKFRNLTKNEQKKLENNAKQIVMKTHMEPYIRKLKNVPAGTHIKYTPLSQNEFNKRSRSALKMLLNKQAQK